MVEIRHRTATVDGQRGLLPRGRARRRPRARAAARLPDQLVHVPRSDPALADRYHVIAPDHLGFGPPTPRRVDEFDYTFDALTDLTAGPARPARASTGTPSTSRTTAPRSAGGSRCDPGRDHRDHHPERQRLRRRVRRDLLGRRVWAYAATQTPTPRPPCAGALTLDATRWQYLNGVADESLVSPDTWTHDYALLDRPGNDEIQLQLFRDYPTNVALYPALQEYFRTSQVPLLAPSGAQATRSSGPTAPAPSAGPAGRRDPPARLRPLRPGEPPGRHRRSTSAASSAEPCTEHDPPAGLLAPPGQWPASSIWRA